MEKEKTLSPYLGYLGSFFSLALFFGPILLAIYVSPVINTGSLYQ